MGMPYFTWLNTTATIRCVLKFDTAAIQGQHLLYLRTYLMTILFSTYIDQVETISELNDACCCV